MNKKYLKMNYDELINFIQNQDCYGELISEEDLIATIKDRLDYGFYGQAENLIEILREQHDPFSSNNYYKNDCGSIIPLLTKDDLLQEFSYLFD